MFEITSIAALAGLCDGVFDSLCSWELTNRFVMERIDETKEYEKIVTELKQDIREIGGIYYTWFVAIFSIVYCLTRALFWPVAIVCFVFEFIIGLILKTEIRS